LKGLQVSVTLCISDLVLEETKRNLTNNAPETLPYFTIIADLLSPQATRPTKAEVLRATQLVHLKDAPIVAAAAKANAEYLATHDVKHLLAQSRVIEQAYGITVLTPAKLLRILTNPHRFFPLLFRFSLLQSLTHSIKERTHEVSSFASYNALARSSLGLQNSLSDF
jgi:predicted nucleic acid-binding protein